MSTENVTMVLARLLVNVVFVFGTAYLLDWTPWQAFTAYMLLLIYVNTNRRDT